MQGFGMISKKKRVAVTLMFLAALVITWLFAPVFARSRALAVMHLYDLDQTAKGHLKEYPYQVELPYRDPLVLQNRRYSFLPVMNTFDASDGFTAWSGKKRTLIIDYAVPDFDKNTAGFRQSFSSFYDHGHPLYNSYFGCYYFGGDRLDKETALAVMEYDIRLLALPAIGLPAGQSTFELKQVQELDAITMGGLEWTIYDAKLVMNGPEHPPQDFKTGYLQFGKPPAAAGEGLLYPTVEMYGRIYITTLKEEPLSLGLFGIASSKEALEGIAETYLEKAELKVRRKLP